MLETLGVIVGLVGGIALAVLRRRAKRARAGARHRFRVGTELRDLRAALQKR